MRRALFARDNVPVVVHDSTLRRTHDLGKRVSRLTEKELNLLEVPSLSEVLKLPCQIIIDMKERPADVIRWLQQKNASKRRLILV